jgi:hypothetical protein
MRRIERCKQEEKIVERKGRKYFTKWINRRERETQKKKRRKTTTTTTHLKIRYPGALLQQAHEQKS